jgi:methanogenic corrinoid protein MtbC1
LTGDVGPGFGDPGGDGSGGPDLPAHIADHLDAELQRAITWDKPVLFADCVAWASAALIQSGLPAAALTRHLEQRATVMRRQPAGAEAVVLAAMQTLADDAQAALPPAGSPLSPLATLYYRALLRGDRHLASRLVLQAVEQGTPVKHIYLQVFQPAQREIGRLWQLNRISVAEEHYCTAATQLIMSQLYPYVFSSPRIGRTVVAVCVSGDLHELGARMVADFFEMDGWDSYFTGASTPMSGVVQAIIGRRADVLAISATITHHIADVERLIGLVRHQRELAGLKIIVGGFPFNRDPDLWKRVGADGTGPDAESAVALANRLLGDRGARR